MLQPRSKKSMTAMAQRLPRMVTEATASSPRWKPPPFSAQFLDETIEAMRRQLESVRSAKTVIAAVHHVPFAELLPPHHGAQWDFVRAYLGSPRIGAMIRSFENVRHVLCGHSHFPVEAQKRVSIPNPLAAASALAAMRSLKECVGFAVSSFRCTSMSSAAEILGAGTSGVGLGSAVSRWGSRAPRLQSEPGSSSAPRLPSQT
jgi:hypothetical protein